MATNSSFVGAIPPPPGVRADPNAPPTLALSAFLIGTLFELIIPIIGFFVRLYVRLGIVKKWNRVDWCFLLSGLIFMATVPLGLSFPALGIGRHAWDLAPDRLERFLKLNNIQQLMYDLGILFSKATILLQLQEVFIPMATLKSWRWRFILITLILNTIFYTIEVFLKIFECTPREKIWNRKIEGHCLDINKEFISTSSVNVVEDFAILILPIYWVYQLKLSWRRKLSIYLVLGLGLVIFRLVSSIQTLGDPDFTVSRVPVALFAQAELSAAMLIPVLPLLPRFFKHILGRESEGYHQSRNPSTGRRYYHRNQRMTHDTDDISMSNLRNSGDTVNAESQITNDSTSNDKPWDQRHAIIKTTSINQESHRISEA